MINLILNVAYFINDNTFINLHDSKIISLLLFVSPIIITGLIALIYTNKK